MQNGGKKGRSTVDNVMILLSIIERNKYLGKDTFITYADIEKCFDNIWLDDAVTDIWKDGMNVRDAITIRKMNQKATASVVTPFGESAEFQVESAVKQGGVSGVTMCCSSLDKINISGRKIVTMYGPELELNAVAYVDDIGSAGSARTANNTIFNCNILEKRKPYP